METFVVQLALSVAVATILYVAASFFGEWLIAILFYAYIVFAAVSALFNMRTFRAWMSDPASDSYLFVIAREFARVQDKSAITRLRERAAGVMTLVYTNILWPAVQVKGFLLGLKMAAITKTKGISFADLAARIKLDGFDLPCAVFSLSIIIAAAAAHFIHGVTSPYLRYILFVCVGTIGLRHLEYIVSPGGLHQRLRQGRGDPQVNFIVVTLADFLALVIAYVALRHWSNGAPLSWDSVRSTVEALAGSITVAKELWERPEIWREVLAPSVETASSLSGLLLTTALVKIVWEFKNFTRENEDYLQLAQAFAMIGEFREGLKWANRAQVSPKLLIAKAALRLGLGDAPAAVQSMQSALADLKQDGLDNLAINWPPLLAQVPVPKASVSALLQELTNMKVGDAALSRTLSVIFSIKKFSGEEALEAFRPYPAEDHPLAFATIYSELQRATEAYDLLAAAKPQREIDDILRRTALYDVGLVAKASNVEEARPLAEVWLAEHATTMGRLIAALKTDVEKTIVLLQLSRPILIARTIGGATQAYLEKLRGSLRADLERNPENEPILNLEAKAMDQAAAAMKA